MWTRRGELLWHIYTPTAQPSKPITAKPPARPPITAHVAFGGAVKDTNRLNKLLNYRRFLRVGVV